MKTLLVVGGVLLILLAIVLFVAALVVFVIARRRAAAAQGDSTQRTTPKAAPSPVDSAATVMVEIPGRQKWGELYASAGALAGRTFPIDPNGIFIGRDRTLSQIVIDSASVSKRHVWVGVREGLVVAIDQHSTNGTYLNDPGNAITETKLSPGDTLILADDVGRFTYRL
jgi:hypothetical protein